MIRVATTLLVCAVALAGVTGCQKRVEVQTGTRIICTYGEVVSDNVKTATVPADQASRFRVRTVTRLCERHAKLEELYRLAQADIAAGDLKAAKSKLAQIVADDPGFENAQSQLDTIADGGKPNPSGGSGASDTPTGTPKPGGGTGDTSGALTKWIPQLKGYTAGKPVVDVLTVAREYVPADDDKIVNLVIAAEQFANSAAAKQSLTSEIKPHYSKNAATVQVNGHSAYFGTDGRRFAVVAFYDGPVLVALEMSTRDSGSPQALKSALVTAGEQLP